jgi:hypothetical protein
MARLADAGEDDLLRRHACLHGAENLAAAHGVKMRACRVQSADHSLISVRLQAVVNFRLRKRCCS